MNKILIISLALAVILGLATTDILYARDRDYAGDRDIRSSVKEFNRGVQAKDIQSGDYEAYSSPTSGGQPKSGRQPATGASGFGLDYGLYN